MLLSAPFVAITCDDGTTERLIFGYTSSTFVFLNKGLICHLSIKRFSSYPSSGPPYVACLFVSKVASAAC